MFARDPSSRWRITCFTTRMEWRRQGVASTALAAAVEAIRKRGGGRVKASLVGSRTLDQSGTMSMFERVGFQPVRRDKPAGSDQWWIPHDRVLMRLKV